MKTTQNVLALFALPLCLLASSSAFAQSGAESPLEKLPPGTQIRVESALQVRKASFGVEVSQGVVTDLSQPTVAPGYKCWLARNSAAISDYSIPAGMEFTVSSRKPMTLWTARVNTTVQYGNGVQMTSAPANFITYIYLEENEARVDRVACWAYDVNLSQRKPVIYDFDSNFSGVLRLLPDNN